MKVVWTAAARSDLDDILAHTAKHYPATVEPLERRIRAALARIGRWAESARMLDQHPAVRVIPLVRYPYRIFYWIAGDAVEILHVHHASRVEPTRDAG